MNNHVLTRSNGLYLWQYFDEQGIPYSKSDFPFLTQDNQPIVKAVLDFDFLCNLHTSSQVVGYLYQQLGNPFAYITPVLDHDFAAGFNDHSDRHTLWIALQTAELLARSGKQYDGKGLYNSVSEVIAALAGMLHDIGILVDRHRHSEYSVLMLEQLMYNTDKHLAEWEALLDAIKFHEEPTLVDLHMPIKNLTPLSWALIIADKIHYGRDRVSPKMVSFPLSDNPMEQDLHLLVNSMIARSTWYLEADRFIYHIDFSIRELADRFQNYTNGKDRLWVPNSIYQKYAANDTPYRDSFIELFTQLYQPRMDIATKAAFLLFPWLTHFEVRLSDSDAHHKVDSELVKVFEVEK